MSYVPPHEGWHDTCFWTAVGRTRREEWILLASNGQSIADAFGLGQMHGFRYAAEGMMARVWRLDTSSGSFAVKEFDQVPDRYALHAQLQLSARLTQAATAAGICAPRTVRTPAGDLLHHISDDGGCAVYVSVLTWIEGRRVELRRDAADAATWLDETFAIIESIPDPANAPALDPWLARFLTESPTDTQWHEALDHAQQAQRAWAPLLQSRIPRLISLGSIVGRPSGDQESFLHTDLQPKNVLVTTTGFGLLDWDDAALCSRDRMLARILIEWFTPGEIDTAAIHRFMTAYRSRGGRGRIRDLSDFGHAVAAYLNYVHETIISDLSTTSGYPGPTKQITSALTDPLSVSTLTRVLDIVQTEP